MKTLISLILACLLIGPSLCSASPVTMIQIPKIQIPKKIVPVHKTHYYEARMVGKKFVWWRLVRSKDGHLHHEIYPYGKAILSQAGPIKKYGVIKFHALMKARRKALNFKPVKPVQRASGVSQARLQPRSSPTLTANFALGYSPSTGYLPTSTCFDATVLLNNAQQKLSFSSSGTASSVSSEMNVEASINANWSADVASASAGDVYTYGNQYGQSGESGSFLFTAYQIWTASNTPSGLNKYGKGYQDQGTLSAYCGSNFVSSLPVGMLITGQASYSSSSTNAATAANNAFNAQASGGALSSTFSAAVSAAYGASSSSTNNTNSFGFTSTVFGGGEGAASLFSEDAANASGLLGTCSEGSTADCNSYVTALNDAAANALTNFSAYFGTSDADTSNLAAFPNGVDGAIGLTSIVASDSVSTILSSGGTQYSGLQYNDVFSGLGPQIQNYLTILNQISTLYARVNYLSTQLATSNGVSSFYSPNMDLSPYLSIRGTYLTPLINAYSKDISNIRAALSTCLSSTNSTDAANNCNTITTAYNNGITSAYAWYSSTSNGTFNNLALQNSIALQYTGQLSISHPANGDGSGATKYSNWGLDMAWTAGYPDLSSMTTGLPSASTSANYSTSPPSFYPGIIAFADQPYYFINSTTETLLPYVMLLPTSTTGITSFSTPASNYSSYNYNISQYGSDGGIGWQIGSGGQGTVYYVGCDTASPYPTFSNPCSIYTSYTSPSNTNFPGSTVSVTFFPIANFFGY